jgi:uncharacterized phage protein (TIGR01671 family)
MREIKFRAWDIHKKKMYFGKMYGFGDMDWGNEYVRLPYGSKYELMQFTGLHDKNGKEIYEGDKYRWAIPGNNAEYGEVVFKNGCFWCDRYQDGESFELYSMLDRVEVIGNIHDHEADK